ncbi:Uncharacterized protein ALO59_04369 [Pseudomonas amygdali pv. mellea]|nr:Uncharacterized protein ALO51_00457 [Pseudomonas amygdali]KPX82403.1 Uncharacterized protein ALO59_04369 [Pseudomonas amygdali pv. mellea]
MQERLGANADKINVNRQGRGVQQLRSMMPEHFGAAFLIRRNQVTPQHYVFGLEDLPGRESLPKTRYGEYLRPDGTPFGNIAPPHPSSTRLPKGDHLVLVIPRGHKTAQVVGDMNRALKKVREAAGAVGDAELGHIRAKSGLSEAIEGLDSEKNKAAYRVLGSTPFCLAVLMLEVWNVSSESEAVAQANREKSFLRASAGVISAGVDLIIAVEALAVKLTGVQQQNFFSRKIFYEISVESAEKWLGVTLGAATTKKISARLIAQISSGGLLAAINFYDVWHSWQWNDQAMYGYLLIAMGGLSGSLSSMFGGAAILSGLNPAGWAALLLIGTGVGLVIMLSPTPLESWLANGPFGESNSIDQHLQDPSEAFYRLTSLLAGISISIEKNPDYDPRATFDRYAQLPHAIRRSDTIVRLRSRLPGLIGSFDSLSIEAECRTCRITEKMSNQGIPYSAQKEITDRPETPNAQCLYADALELFFTTPINQVSPTGSSRHYYTWAVRAQFILITKREKRYFPAPKLRDSTQHSKNWATPSFNEVDQPFWADEVTYKGPLND